MALIHHPISPRKRIEGIDLSRGVALFGILLVNILGFNASFFDFGGYYGSLPDPFQQAFYRIFINFTADKFIFLFSFLYGYGIWMQREKFAHELREFQWFFLRRMLLLACLGILHIVLLWAGDILLLYAIAGTLLLPVYRLRSRFLIPLALFFYFFIIFWLLADAWLDLPNALSSAHPEWLATAKALYPQGGYLACLELRLQEYFAFRNINAVYYLTKVMGIILMGFMAARGDLFHRIINHRRRWTTILVALAAIGAIIYAGYEKIVDFERPYANALYMLGYELMNVFVATSYLLLIWLLSTIKAVGNFLKPVASMGCMSLTNYLAQSVILSTIFYGWGLGFFGQTSVTLLIGLAVGIYFFLMLLTLIWFRYRPQGPLEQLWRAFSYGNK